MMQCKAITISVILGLVALIPLISHAEEQITVTPGPQPVAIDSQLQAQQLMNDVPGNTLLMDNSQWSNERAENVKDITDYMPGVFAQPRDGAESDRLSVRGSGLANIFQGEGLLLLQDGIPLNMADGEFEFPVIDPWLTQFTEVFPGANALQYGGSNFGGAINFITPTGITDNGYDVRSEVGSFGTFHGQASVGKAWQGGDMFTSAGGFTQNGFRSQNEQDTSRFNGNIGTQINDDVVNRVYINHTHSDAEIPGAISMAALNISPRQANPTNLALNYQRDLDITRIADKTAWQSGDDRVETALFYTYRTLDNPVTTYEFQHTNDVGATAKYTHQFNASKWILGFNDYYGFGDETRFQDLDAQPGAHLISRNLSALTSEVYSEYEQHLIGKLYGIADAQGSYALRDIEQTFPTLASQNERYIGFNPRIGLRYDIAYEKQIFANLSRSFDPPTWSDMVGNNPGFINLKAQKATTAEIGTRLLAYNLHWQAAYYHSWLNDELVNYQFANGNTATINAAKSKKDGIELGIDGDIKNDIWTKNDALAVRAAYTFSHYTLNHDALYGNNTLPGVPENYIRAEILYRHPMGISLGPNVEWVPNASPVDLTNSFYTESYAIYGFRAFWEGLDQRLHIYIEGRNLFNKDYIATNNVVPNAGGHDGSYFYPGEGRAVFTGFRWKL